MRRPSQFVSPGVASPVSDSPTSIIATRVGLLPAGLRDVAADGTRILVGDADADLARVYDLSTSAQVGTRQWGCDIQNLTALHEFGNGILVLGDDLLCFSRTVDYP